MHRFQFAVLALFFAGLPLAQAQGPGDFTEIAIFGDSLSDQGNIAQLTFGFIPGPAYFNGRFSNGPIWVEEVAAELGLSTSASGLNISALNGNNFAFGGSRIAESQNILFLNLPGVRAQINAYLGAAGPLGPDTLYVVTGGGNDIRDALDPTFSTGGLSDLAYVESVAQQMAMGVEDLINAGARFIVVGLSADIGRSPESVFVNNNAAQATLLSQGFNQELGIALQNLRDTRDVCIVELDFFQLSVDIVNDAQNNGGATFGITNVSTPALPGPAGSLGADPNVSLFWDDLHPTARAHEIAADRVLAELAEERLPGSDEDFALGLAVDGLRAPAACPAFAQVGQSINLSFESPGGAWVGSVASLLGQGFLAGAPPASPLGFPELWVNQNGAVFLGNFGVFAGASSVTIPVVPGLEGTRLILQAVISTPSAANGIFVAGDARELVLE